MVSSLLEGAESCQGGEVPPPPGGEVPRNVRDAMAQKNKVDLFGPFFPRFFLGGVVLDLEGRTWRYCQPQFLFGF